jgi:hypothetical protein
MHDSDGIGDLSCGGCRKAHGEHKPGEFFHGRSQEKKAG